MKSRTWVLSGLIVIGASFLLSQSHVARFFQSYLFSYLLFMELTLGSLSLLMIYHLTGGAWGRATHYILEASTRTLYWVALLFIPVLIGAKTFYPWAITAPHGHLASYLNLEGFSIRAVFYFFCWSALAYLLLRSRHRGPLSAAGLIFLGVSASFAAIDWQMSLEPHWYSTIYGLIFLIGQALGAWAFTLVVFNFQEKKTSVSALTDLANVLLILVMLWAYLSFMQYLVIWSGNLPDEVPWINKRIHATWKYLALFLISFQFAVPFIFLLFRDLKRRLPLLALLCGIILGVRVADRYWMVMPSLHPLQIDFSWTDLSLVLGVGSIWFGAFKFYLQNPRELSHARD